jgi:hypothetical protein
MTPTPRVLTLEEEEALLFLLGNLQLNGASQGHARPLIRLLWDLELREATRDVLAGETIQ